MGKSLNGVNWKIFSIAVLSDEIRPFNTNGELGPSELAVLLSGTSF